MSKLATPSRSADSKENNYEELKQRIHNKLVDKLDLSRVGELEGETLRREISKVIVGKRVNKRCESRCLY
jgi:pilus assembly protein CpaF